MGNYPLNRTERLRNLKELKDRRRRLFGQKQFFKSMASKTKEKAADYTKSGGGFLVLAKSLICGFFRKRTALFTGDSKKCVLKYSEIINSNITFAPFKKELAKEEMLSFLQF